MTRRSPDGGGTDEPPDSLLASAIDDFPAHVAVLDGDGAIVYVNRAWDEFAAANQGPGGTGVFLGENYLDVCRASGSDEEPWARRAASGLEDVLAGQERSFRMEYPCHGPDEKRWFLFLASPVSGGQGAVLAHVDITQRKLMEEGLTYQAFHDPLTNLPNRALFMEHLDRARARAEREDRHVAVLYLDVDDFKEINDRHGHVAGDRVLVEVARRIEAELREGDLVARLGGDEFAVVLEHDPTSADAVTVANRLLHRLRASIPLDQAEASEDPRPVDITVSIGIVQEVAPDEDREDVLRRADRAMYWVKEQGKDGQHLEERIPPDPE